MVLKTAEPEPRVAVPRAPGDAALSRAGASPPSNDAAAMTCGGPARRRRARSSAWARRPGRACRTRRVRLVRGEGRGVSTQYEGGGGGGGGPELGGSE